MARQTYTKNPEWKDGPDETTPILAENLNHIEEGIKTAMDDRALKEIYGDENVDLTAHDPYKTIGARSIQHGYNASATGSGSYAGGSGSVASGNYSHAEGSSTKAIGTNAHVEGLASNASGSNSHAEGYQTKTEKDADHAEGYSTVASGGYSHAEGVSSTASGNGSHAEGNQTTASGEQSHAEGFYTVSSGTYAHAEGQNATASAPGSHAEGYNTKSQGNYGHAEGYETKAYCGYGHAEGYKTTAGRENSTMLNSAHAEGESTQATGQAAHSEGTSTIASGAQSHAEGNHTTASGEQSHAEGIGTNAVGSAQHVSGRYNIEASQMAVIVGGGTSDSDRKNIYMLDWQGNAIFSGNVQGTYNGRQLSLYGIQSEMESRFNFLNKNIMPAKVFDTKSVLDEWLSEEGNAETLKVGQNIYITESGTPDYWWDGTGLQVLETDKVEIESMTYDETTAALASEETGEINKIPNIYAIRDWCKQLINQDSGI